MSYKKNSSRVISMLLALCLAVSLFSGCAAKETATTDEPEMTRAGEDGFLHVDYNSSGEYTVSFGAGDFVTSESHAEEEMDREFLADAEMTGISEETDVAVSEEAADTAPNETGQDVSDETEQDVLDEAEQAVSNETEQDVSDDTATEGTEESSSIYFSGLKQEDISIIYSLQEDGSDDVAERSAAITAFSNEGGIIEISFTDPDAAEYKTGGYLVSVLDGKSGTMIEVDFPDHSITTDVSEISAASDSNEVTLSLAEGSFSDSIAPGDITLDQSFKDMTVDAVSANGGYLTVSLSGSPVIDTEVSNVYTAGEIRVSSDAVVDAISDISAYVDVQAPMIGVDHTAVEAEGGQVTFPVTLTGVEAGAVSESDVSFDGAGTVTGVSAEGDTLLVTVKPDDGDTDGLYGDLSVGDASMVVGTSHASVGTVFDYIEEDGDDLLVTLNMYSVMGTISEDISEKSFELDMGFEGGKVESISRTDEKNAEVIIRFPANGMTAEDYDIIGEFRLMEGALIDDNGALAPEFVYSRRYVPEELGRDRTPLDQIKDYADIGQKVYKYGKPVYDIATAISSGNYSGAITGAFSFFSLIFGNGSEEVDVGKELKEIKAEIANVQTTLKEIDEKVGRIEAQTEQNRLVDFENNVGLVESYSGLLEQRLAIAKSELEKQGIKAPKNDKESIAYYDKLIKYCTDKEKAGDTRFRKFEDNMAKLLDYFLKVSIEASKKEASSPFYAFENYYMEHYNFSTQSYHIRAAYMANVDLQLKRAYNILAIYHNIPAYPDENVEISKRFIEAVTAIENRDLGSSPADVPSGKAKIYSSTFKKTFVEGFVGGYLNYDGNDLANCFGTYTSKLYGSTMKDDLTRAGFDLKNAEAFGLKKTKGPVAELIKVSKYQYQAAGNCYYHDYILFSNGQKKNTRTYRDQTVTYMFFPLDESMRKLSKG